LAKSFQTIFMGSASSNGEHWIATLAGSTDDLAYGVTVDSLDNIILCGWTSSSGAGSRDVLVAKYDSLGEQLWDKTLGGQGTDEGYSVIVDSSDNIIVCGLTRVYGTSLYQLLVAKYNSSETLLNLQLLWNKKLGGSVEDMGYGVAIDSSDNIIVCGWTLSGNAGLSDLLVAKYNSSGVLQWDKTLGGSDNERAYGVTVDSLDNIIVCGRTNSDGEGDDDVLVAKYNSSGVLQWDKTLGSIYYNNAFGVAVDSLDNIIVCGDTSPSIFANQIDILVAKYNSSGVLQWDKKLVGVNQNKQDYGRGVTIDSLDNIIVCGTTTNNAGTFDFLVAKYNSSGVLQWDKTLGSIYNDRALGVAVDSLDNIIVCGYSRYGELYYDKILFAKLPPDGTGDGTYEGIVYQDAGMTSTNAGLTDAAAVLTDAAAVLTDAAAGLVSGNPVLTSELIPI